jgi:imidazolonepropionase-like amidohydrolase
MHVAIIDTRGGALEPDMTVAISGDRILQVEKANDAHWNGAAVLDGRGKYLIPGLWDMEVHLS